MNLSQKNTRLDEHSLSTYEHCHKLDIGTNNERVAQYPSVEQAQTGRVEITQRFALNRKKLKVPSLERGRAF